jgi:uncharacterized membrane protein
MIIKNILHRYFVQAMGAMAMGLFASLIIGVILKQIFTLAGIADYELCRVLLQVTDARSPVVGAAIGAAVGFGLKSRPLALYSATVLGALGYGVQVDSIAAGPVGAFLAALAGAETGNFLSGKTRLDILVVPGCSLLAGGAVGVLLGPPVAMFMSASGELINQMTLLQPLPMGIMVSALMGLALTAPISSAALAIMLGLSGLAGGAATAGCCAHMVSFAVASYRDNRLAGLLAQGLGTSMLQVGNIVLHPQILIPAVCASVITGPLATVVLQMENIPAGSGMGTSGLVGILTTFSAMSYLPFTQILAYTMILYVAAPALIAGLTAAFMRRRGWIKDGHMRLEL